jgi:hypothetical protein
VTANWQCLERPTASARLPSLDHSPARAAVVGCLASGSGTYSGWLEQPVRFACKGETLTSTSRLIVMNFRDYRDNGSIGAPVFQVMTDQDNQA